MNRLVLISCCLVFFTACVKVEDTLTIHQDGSGTIELCVDCGGNTSSSVPETVYPPLRVRDAFALFPIHQFQTKVAPCPDHEKGIKTTATFPDLATLLASPYAKAHRLKVQATYQGTMIQCTSGMEIAQIITAMKKKSESEANFKNKLSQDFQTGAFKDLRWKFTLIGPDCKAESKFDFADNEDLDDMAEEANRTISIKSTKLPKRIPTVTPFLANLTFDQAQESEIVLPSATTGAIRDQSRLQVRRSEFISPVPGWVDISGFIVVPEGVSCLVPSVYDSQRRSVSHPHLVTPTGAVLEGLVIPERAFDFGRPLKPEIWGDGLWRYPVRVYCSVDSQKKNIPADWQQVKQMVLSCLVQATSSRSILRFAAIGEKDAWDRKQHLERTLKPCGLNLRVSRDEKTDLRSISIESLDIGSIVEDLQLYDARGKAIPQAHLRNGSWLLVEEPKYPLSLALRLRKATAEPITLRLEGNIP